MRCGAKRFIVELEQNGKSKQKEVVARTPAEARRLTRLRCGENTHILSVKEKNR